jgi:hypothetical protein
MDDDDNSPTSLQHNHTYLDDIMSADAILDKSGIGADVPDTPPLHSTQLLHLYQTTPCSAIAFYLGMQGSRPKPSLLDAIYLI